MSKTKKEEVKPNVKEDTKEVKSFFNTETNILGGVLLYVCIKNPAKPSKESEKTCKEWKVQVCVDEDTADAWDEVFKKQPSHSYKNEEFEERFRIPPPFEGKKQYVITVRKNTEDKDGKPIPYKYAPKVFIRSEVTGKLKDITKSTEVGNGSLGEVQIFRADTPVRGSFAYLSAVKVKDLIEYVKTSVMFGEEVELDDSEDEDSANRYVPKDTRRQNTEDFDFEDEPTHEPKELDEDDPFA